MNPAQGSPPSFAAEESAPGDRKSGQTEELHLSPVRGYKAKSPSLPFSVESLISERTQERRLFFPGGRQARVLSEGTEGSPPGGLYQSSPDPVEPREREVDHWSHTPHTSPPSEYERRFAPPRTLFVAVPLSSWFWKSVRSLNERNYIIFTCRSKDRVASLAH